ncbi:MAG: Ferrous iron transport protein A [Tenericutes bacterium ADurb.Bin087]|nr:MAG: Ferrous iron transport protein A [Tenericutes bacterium ADurb.Bin087]
MLENIPLLMYILSVIILCITTRRDYSRVSDMQTLDMLKIGQRARVLRINDDNPALKQRLLDMGITTGVIVRIDKISPLGDPFCLELRNYRLLVRRADVSAVEIEVLP